MRHLEPRVPSNLNPYARELLEMLRGQPAARHIIPGGGVALSHYHEYRETVDVDAWWVQIPNEADLEETVALLRATMRALGERGGFDYSERKWGDTLSLELRRGSRKIFSFQISTRDVQLEPPVEAEWSPVKIEAFRDNLGSKMNALVERGAPRDFVDIATVCLAGIVTVAECWTAWRDKGSRRDSVEAKCIVLRSLAVLEVRRPIEKFGDPAAKQRAVAVREFIRGQLCASGDTPP